MIKVTNVIDGLSHNASLEKKLAGKGITGNITEKAEVMLRETKGQVADEILSKKANDAIKATVTPQIKNPKISENLTTNIMKSVEESQAKIKRLGLVVDEEAQKIAERYIEHENRVRLASNDSELMERIKESIKLNKECIKKGYDYLEGYTPIKLNAQTNEALSNLVKEYPNSVLCEKALQMLKARGVM